MDSTMEMRLNTCMSLGSQLPFIFVNGRPACLEMMTVPQLKRFIQLMLKCEGLGNKIPTAEDVDCVKPNWWPSNVEYSPHIYGDDMPKSEQEEKLRNIIRRCYQHYNLCTFINLSSILSDPNGLFGVVKIDDNGNGTTNILSFSNQLVATVRTNVVKYDEKSMLLQQKLVINGGIYNRPVFKLIKQKCKTYPDAEGKLKLPLKKMKEINEFNPIVKLPKCIFVDSKGAKVRHPFVENISEKNSVNTINITKDGENVFKIDDCLSDCPPNKSSTTETINLRLPKPKKKTANWTKKSKKGKAKAPVIVPIASACNHCGKVFSGDDFRQEHEQDCTQAPCSSKSLTESARKAHFISMLDLVPAGYELPKRPPMTERVKMIKQKMLEKLAANKVSYKKRVVKKPKTKKLSTFFKANPIPCTSGLGLELVQNCESGQATEEEKTASFDQDCGTRALSGRSVPVAGSSTWPTTTLKKNIIQNTDSVHKYSFNTRQRRRRNAELVLGINSKAWNMFNKCKRPVCSLKRLTLSELSSATTHCGQCTADATGKLQLKVKKKVKDNSCTFKPVIRLTDLKTDPKYAKYFN